MARREPDGSHGMAYGEERFRHCSTTSSCFFTAPTSALLGNTADRFGQNIDTL
ncbi:hypothetical protein ACIOJD_22515 [Streptomyces sp. NPDC088116]|uniref:hypothetical protein n=1 Tax=Streptomyces sp. NPDC088116 TaxID=3365825 RepID=UPI003801BC07